MLSNVVLDLDIDELVSWDEMMNGGRRIEQAWNTRRDVMPLAPAWLAAQFPRLWETVDAVKADLAEWRSKECRFTNIFSTGNSTLFQHQYRPAVLPKQRAWSLCLSSNSDPAVTRVALEALVGAVTMVPAQPARPAPGRRVRAASGARSTRTKH